MTQPPSLSLHSTPGSSPKLRVLVVDDHDSVRDAIAGLLNARGFEAEAVDSGETALERLRANYYDVLVTDILMPGMSGLDVITEALKLDRNMPVLALTAVSDNHTARDAIQRGAMDYLTKPVEMDDLAKAVESAGNYRRSEIKRRSGPQVAIPETEEERGTLVLSGGPLDARRVRVEDPHTPIWVVHRPEGEQAWASHEPPSNLGAGARTLGSYVFSADKGTMLWTPSAS